MRAFVAVLVAWITILLEVALTLLCEWGFRYAPSWMKIVPKDGVECYSLGIGFMMAVVGLAIGLTGVFVISLVWDSKD